MAFKTPQIQFQVLAKFQGEEREPTNEELISETVRICAQQVAQMGLVPAGSYVPGSGNGAPVSSGGKKLSSFQMFCGLTKEKCTPEAYAKLDEVMGEVYIDPDRKYATKTGEKVTSLRTTDPATFDQIFCSHQSLSEALAVAKSTFTGFAGGSLVWNNLTDVQKTAFGQWAMENMSTVSKARTGTASTGRGSTGGSAKSGHNLIKTVFTLFYKSKDQTEETELTKQVFDFIQIPAGKPKTGFNVGREVWGLLSEPLKQQWHVLSQQTPKDSASKVTWLSGNHEVNQLFIATCKHVLGEQVPDAASVVTMPAPAPAPAPIPTNIRPKAVQSESKTPAPNSNPNPTHTLKITSLKGLPIEFMQGVLNSEVKNGIQLKTQLRTKLLKNPEAMELWDENDPQGSIEQMVEAGLL